MLTTKPFQYIHSRRNIRNLKYFERRIDAALHLS